MCIFLIAVLTISNVWLYSTIDSLQKQASSLNTSYNDLESQLVNLQSNMNSTSTTRSNAKPTLLWKFKTGDHVQRTSISNSLGSNTGLRIVAGSDDKGLYVFDMWGLV